MTTQATGRLSTAPRGQSHKKVSRMLADHVTWSPESSGKILLEVKPSRRAEDRETYPPRIHSGGKGRDHPHDPEG